MNESRHQDAAPVIIVVTVVAVLVGIGLSIPRVQSWLASRPVDEPALEPAENFVPAAVQMPTAPVEQVPVSPTAPPNDDEFMQDIAAARSAWASGAFQEQLSFAMRAAQEAISKDQQAIADYWIGVAYYKLGNLNDAEIVLRESVGLSPANAGPSYATLAVVANDQGKPSIALDYADRAISLLPDYAWAHNSRGIVLMALGRELEGIAEFQKAISLEPDNLVFRQNLKWARGQ